MEVLALDQADRLLGPRPAWFAHRRFAAWSAGRSFVGWVLWSHFADEDAEAGKQLWIALAARMAPPFDFVLDLRALESLSHGAYTRIREFATTGKPGLRRMAILVGEETYGGAIQLGLYAISPPPFAWRSFTRYADAARWLERADAAPVFAEVEPMARAAAGEPSPAADLVRVLAVSPRATVEAAARTLGLSSRSLQRLLRERGTTFSDERDRARVVRARDLLADPAAKLDAVAAEIGCADRRSLNRLFRRLTGETPAEFRARTAARPRS